jgi:molecular chaperone HscB
VLNSIACSFCENQSAEIFCEHCQHLIDRKDSIHFLDFISAGKWFVDPQFCEERYFELSRILHPDLFHQKSQKEKALSEQYFQLLNKAYAFHKDTAALIRYLLKSYDLQFQDKDIPAEWIDEIFEIQDLLKHPFINEEDYQHLKVKALFFKSLLEEYRKEMLAIMIERDNEKLDDMSALQKLAKILAPYNYLERLYEQIDEKIFEKE